MPKVLIFEDDEALGAQIERQLRAAGLACARSPDGFLPDEDDLADVDLVVLDLMLPSMHGFDVLKRIRDLSPVPVLVLSARNDTADKVRGLKLGADDYMTKPFWPEELVERVRARLRRPTLERDGRITVGPLAIDRGRRRTFVDGVEVALAPVEFELLAQLVERHGAAVSRQQLVDAVLDRDDEGVHRALDVHISRLRKKLGRPELVETVWGIGYRVANGPRT